MQPQHRTIAAVLAAVIAGLFGTVVFLGRSANEARQPRAVQAPPPAPPAPPAPPPVEVRVVETRTGAPEVNVIQGPVSDAARRRMEILENLAAKYNKE